MLQKLKNHVLAQTFRELKDVIRHLFSQTCKSGSDTKEEWRNQNFWGQTVRKLS